MYRFSKLRGLPLAFRLLFVSFIFHIALAVPCAPQLVLHEEWSVQGPTSTYAPYRVAANGSRLILGIEDDGQSSQSPVRIYDLDAHRTIRTLLSGPYARPLYHILDNGTEMMRVEDSTVRIVDLVTGADVDSIDAVVTTVIGVTHNSNTIVFYGRLAHDSEYNVYAYDRSTRSASAIRGTQGEALDTQWEYDVQIFPGSNNIMVHNMNDGSIYIVNVDGSPVFINSESSQTYPFPRQPLSLVGPEHIVGYDGNKTSIYHFRDGKIKGSLYNDILASNTTSEIRYLGSHFIIRGHTGLIVMDRDLTPRCTLNVTPDIARCTAAYQRDSLSVSFIIDGGAGPDTTYTIRIADGMVTAHPNRIDIPRVHFWMNLSDITTRGRYVQHTGLSALCAFYDATEDSLHIPFPMPLAYLQTMHARGGDALFAYKISDNNQGIAEVTSNRNPMCSLIPWKLPGEVMSSYRRNAREWLGTDSSKGYVRYATFDTVGTPLPIVTGTTTICPATDGASYFIVSIYGQVQHIDTSGRILSTSGKALPPDASMDRRFVKVQHIAGDTIAILCADYTSFNIYFISAYGLDSTRTITLSIPFGFQDGITYAYDARTHCHAVSTEAIDRSNAALYLIRVNEPILTIPTLYGYVDIAFHHTEDVVAALDRNYGVVLIDTRMGTIRAINQDRQEIGYRHPYLHWSADAESLLVQQYNGIARYDIETGAVKVLVPLDQNTTDNVRLMDDGRHYARFVESDSVRRYHIIDLNTDSIVDSTSYVQLVSGIPPYNPSFRFSNGMFLSSSNPRNEIQEVMMPHRYHRYFDLPDPAVRSVRLEVASRQETTLSVVEDREEVASPSSYVLDAVSYNQLAVFRNTTVTQAPLHLPTACGYTNHGSGLIPLANALGDADEYGNVTQYAHLPIRSLALVLAGWPILEKSNQAIQYRNNYTFALVDITTFDTKDTLPLYPAPYGVSSDERYLTMYYGQDTVLLIYDLTDGTIRGRFVFPYGIERVEWADDPSTILVWHDQLILSAYTLRDASTSVPSAASMAVHPWIASHHDGMLTVRLSTPTDGTVNVGVYTLGGQFVASGGFVGSAAEGTLPLVCAPQPLLLVVRYGEHTTTGVVMATR